MDELLRKRIERALDGLDETRAYQVLDYVEFLQSKYGNRSRGPSAFSKIADGVEDTMRVSKLPIAAIKGTREVFNTAERVMKGLADAGRSVVDELQGTRDDKEDPESEKKGPSGDQEKADDERKTEPA